MFSPSLSVSNIIGTTKKIKRQYDVYKLSGIEGLASNAVTSLIRAIEVKKLDVLENIPFMEKKAEASKQKLEKFDEINNLVEEQLKLFNQLRRQLSKSEGVDLNVIRLLNKSILNISGSIAQKKEEVGKKSSPELSKIKEILTNIFKSQNISIEEMDNSSTQQVSSSNIQNDSLENINSNISTLNRQTQDNSVIADSSEKIVQKIDSKQSINNIVAKESNKNIKDLVENSDSIINLLKSIKNNLENLGETNLPSLKDFKLRGTPGVPQIPRTRLPPIPTRLPPIPTPNRLPPVPIPPVGKTGVLSKIGQVARGAGGKIGQVAKGVGGKAVSLVGRAVPALATFASGTVGMGLGAAAGGAVVGTGINYMASKYIQKVTNNRMQDLGQVFENMVSERRQLEEKNENIRIWRNRLSEKAFNLAGGEKNFSPIAVIKLKNAGEIVRQNNLFVTRNEASSELPDSKEMMASTVKPEVKVNNLSPTTITSLANSEKNITNTISKKSYVNTPVETTNEVLNSITKSSATPIPIVTTLPSKVSKFEKDSKSTETILNSIDSKIASVNKSKPSTPIVLPKNIGGGTPYSRARRDSIADYGIDLIRTSLA